MRRKLLLFAVLAALGASAVWMVFGKTQPSKNPLPADPHVARASIGNIERTIRLSGQTSARAFRNINAPAPRGREAGSALELMKLVKPGTFVTKGDLIAQIDAQAVQDHVDDVADIVKQAEADIRKRKAEHAVEWETLQQTLRQAKADMDKARLDARTTTLLTDIERELLKLNVEETETRYKQLQQDISYHKASQRAEIRILEITLERQKRHHGRHAGDVTRFVINAPMNGLTVMQQTWRGGDTLMYSLAA